MIVLEKFILLERFLGLYSRGGPENILVRIVYLVTFILFNSMELVFFVLNIPNGIVKAAPALTALCGVVPAMACYGQLLIVRERYYSLMNEMQNTVNESMLNSH